MSSMAETRVEWRARTSAIEKIRRGPARPARRACRGLTAHEGAQRPWSRFECVHEVAYDAFSVGPPPLSRDRPDPAFWKARALSA